MIEASRMSATAGLPWSLSWPWRKSKKSEAEEPEKDAQAGERAGFGGEDEHTEWVPVYWASAVPEAHVVRGVLEAEDVPAVLKHESQTAFGGAALKGVQVLVPQQLEGRALEILADDDG